MKKLLFLVSFFLLTAASNWLTATDTPTLATVAVSLREGFDGPEMPLGDGEENSSEEDKDLTEEDDEVGLDHRWISSDKSYSSDLHILYQESLFKDLESEIVIPPPKA